MIFRSAKVWPFIPKFVAKGCIKLYFNYTGGIILNSNLSSLFMQNYSKKLPSLKVDVNNKVYAFT